VFALVTTKPRQADQDAKNMARIDKKADPVAKAARKRGRVSPRAPSRGRGVRRFGVLLDSVEALLGEVGLEDIGLYQIAERAGVPHASVYHFFPTKDAAFLALAQRYSVVYAKQHAEPIDASALKSWQALLEWDVRRAAAFLRAAPPAMKLALGSYGGLEARRWEISRNGRMAAMAWARMDGLFHMPYLRGADCKLLIAIEIVHSVFTVSYARHGEITEAYVQEAVNASVAYLRLYLPERVDLREAPAAAVAVGQPVVPLTAEPSDPPVLPGAPTRN
jgi:AcrR family transcriptional regulator